MPEELSADTDLLRGVGGVQMGMGGTLAAVGTAVSIFPVAALAPVFGPIGAHYLGAFAMTSAKQGLDVGQLAMSVTESGVTTNVASNGYDDADDNIGKNISATVEGIEA
ncbi:Hypothetical protein ERS075564_03395 [Mycobacteroides abscessus]|uniref:Uncharacterized protein n=5 Tax=Mycobacteroides abscessus TaxID=36809 RepID=A0A0U0ZL39_9MYCO|nr:type VII secretion target [Mycobacteroides abscessus]ESV56496.1 hypothetical protein L830_2322 [Mycobacteroides abscessus MAB_082312_2258]ESV64898.1 hypothetical protein L833_2286 [Mycobacteroides abscessus MAB_091912_2446]AGM30278.1 hypothetical protein MASS_3676 [Mycobacteroides abscessus subsp. bolletii 50594]AIC71533.1 hypothetical protein MYCMA_05680 [Mycobacteroides abscessus subsp. massiliense str. GO 06]AMU27414.1 hypothetical protein A3N96_20095 [Mycobacteroides abscessus]